MQYDGQWLRDRRHGTGTLTIENAGKAGGSQQYNILFYHDM